MSLDTEPEHGPRQPPVFILSPPRGLSTVCTALLAGHPAIYGLPEMLTFSVPTIGELLSGVGCACAAPACVHPADCRVLRVRLSGPFRAIAQLHEGCQDPPAIARARAWLISRADWPTERLLSHLLAVAAPRIGLEKSPDTVRCKENLARCLRAYPAARYIHLTRHPVTAQRSIEEHLARLVPRRGRLGYVVNAAAIWYLSHLRIMRALAALPGHQWMRVRGEDLVNEPGTWLPRVLDWLGLEHDDQIVARMLRTEQWTFAGCGPSGVLLGGDYKFMQRPQLRSRAGLGPVAFDPAWGLPAEMRADMAELGRYFGYEVSGGHAEADV
jgi:hypothetical protein